MSIEVLTGFGGNPVNPPRNPVDGDVIRITDANGARTEKRFYTYTAPAAVPKVLTRLQFVELCQSAGGMTDANLVAAKANANLASLWIKLELAQDVERDHASTQAGLAGLAALGYLPNGAQAVTNAWPTS